MTHPIQIWTCASFHPAFRCGGWASIRRDPGQIPGPVTGLAGGDRRTTELRTALSGLNAALRSLPPLTPGGAPGLIEVRTPSPDLAELAGALGAGGGEAPEALAAEDLDLWRLVLAAAAGRRVRLIPAPLQAGTPTGFVMAWAEFARDKAKAGGAFSAPIPKANLAKVPGLAP